MQDEGAARAAEAEAAAEDAPAAAPADEEVSEYDEEEVESDGSDALNEWLECEVGVHGGFAGCRPFARTAAASL